MSWFRRKRQIEQWRVQAILQSEVTGGEPYAYPPMICDGREEAEAQRGRLFMSFAPGMVDVEMERVES